MVIHLVQNFGKLRLIGFHTPGAGKVEETHRID
jgi:hypothetical protein